MDADYHDNELRHTLTEASIRMNWKKALNEVTRGEELSGPIDFGFSKQDITILAGLHMAGDKTTQTKIEDLLTDCNFHRECRNFINGDYGPYLPDPNFTALREAVPDSFEEIKARAPEMMDKWNRECAEYKTMTDKEIGKYGEKLSDFQIAASDGGDIHAFLDEVCCDAFLDEVCCGDDYKSPDNTEDNEEPQF